MIRQIEKQEYEQVIDLFFDTVDRLPAYISHSEMQMGVANTDGIRNNAKIIWESYLLMNPNVFIYLLDNNIVGFIILDIEEEFDNKFGVLCDIIIDKNYNGQGVGKELVLFAEEFFKSHDVTDIFLESGLYNNDAHLFFGRMGFKCVSKIFLKQI